jgi:hypothetical protein
MFIFEKSHLKFSGLLYRLSSRLIEYSDRTEYSAYAERLKESTAVAKRSKANNNQNLTKEKLVNMSFRESVETVNRKWVPNPKNNEEALTIDPLKHIKFRTRDVTSGHWTLSNYSTRKHIRPSVVIYSAPAIDYELIEQGKTTTQTTFYELAKEKRDKLLRSYYELVWYVPWNNTPEETFLSPSICKMLQEDPEKDSRYSLKRLEEFYKVYCRLWQAQRVAPPGSNWHRDNQLSYTMYLTTMHNRQVHLDRASNSGLFKAQYEPTDDAVDENTEIRADIHDGIDDSDFPNPLTFLPPDTFRGIIDQKPPDISEINVAFRYNTTGNRLRKWL